MSRNDSITLLTPPSDAFSSFFRHDASDSPTSKGILSGFKIAVKDNIDVAGTRCPAGLTHLANYIPGVDAHVVSRLRKEGGVIIGMTKTDCGAFGVTTPDVTNPNFPNCIVGGSSGGSAAAVAAGLCDIAVGTDTSGSVRIPAACCGVWGFKPTYGKVPIEGVLPLTNSFDHVGALASCPRLLHNFMKAVDPSYKHCSMLPEICKQGRTIRVGIGESYLADACNELKDGIKEFQRIWSSDIVEFTTVELPDPDEVQLYHSRAIFKEAADLYAFLPEENFKYLSQVAQKGLSFGRTVTTEQYEESEHKRAEFAKRVECLFEKVDFILVPTLPILPPTVDTEQVTIGRDVREVSPALVFYTSLFNQTGHPTMAFPIHLPQCSTMGSLQIVGRLHGDVQVIQIGIEVERKIGQATIA